MSYKCELTIFIQGAYEWFRTKVLPTFNMIRKRGIKEKRNEKTEVNFRKEYEKPLN